MKTYHLVFAVLISAFPSCGGVLFTEDFESYADGSILGGQNGWQDDTTGTWRMRVGNGNYLPTRVLDGRDITICCGGISSASKPLAHALDPLTTSVLSFDAYAVSTATSTTNTGVYFGKARGALNDISLGWGMQMGHMVFDARFATGNQLNEWSIPYPAFAAYDRPGKLEVIVDGPNGVVFGRYDFGGGISGETVQFAITNAQISQLAAVTIFVDFNTPGRLGGEFDNILVEDVPEPAGMALLGLAGMMVLVIARSRR